MRPAYSVCRPPAYRNHVRKACTDLLPFSCASSFDCIQLDMQLAGALMQDQPYHCETCAADFAEFQHHALSPAKQQSLNMFSIPALCTIISLQHTAFRLTGNAVCIRVLATSRGSTHAHMNMPESPPHVTADAESFSVARMPGSGLSGAVLPGNVRRRVCRCQQVVMHSCGCVQTCQCERFEPTLLAPVCCFTDIMGQGCLSL